MKKVVFILGLGCLISSSFAQTNEAEKFDFSLQQAIDYALQNHVNVKNALIDEEIAQQKVKETTGIGLPQINSSADVKDFIEIPTSVIPASAFNRLAPADMLMPVRFGTKYQSTAGFDASQLVFSGEYFLGLQASRVFVELSTRAVTRSKIETAAAVSKAYYTVLVNEERIKLMDANIVRVKTSLDGTNGLYLAGFVEKIDVDRLTVIYNNLLVEREKLIRYMDLGKILLKFQMGMNTDASLSLTDKLGDIKLDAIDSSAEKFDYAKRIEFGLLETQKQLAMLDVKRNKVAFLPSAFAYGALSANSFRNKFNFFDTQKGWYPTALIGGKISMPIFTGFQRNAKLQTAKLSLQKTENGIEMLKKSIDLELASSSIMLQNAKASLENQKKNMVVAEDVYKVSKMKYEQGVGSYIEMLTAETSLKESQTNYFSALFDALVAKVDYDKASGSLSVK